MKAFAREVCRNDVLNFGRLHFFFPDSRLALDLNTDRTLKEVRWNPTYVLICSKHYGTWDLIPRAGMWD